MPESSPNKESAKANPGSRRTASSGVTGRQVLLLPFALLALLSLMDAGRVLHSRHLDLLPFAVMAIAAIIPDTTARTANLWAAAIGTAARLLYGLKKNSLPKPIVPKLSEAVLLILLIAVFAAVAFLHLATGTGGSFMETILAISTSAAIAVALVLIGQRWKDRTLGYTVAIFWLVLPASPPPVAAAVILWSLVFLNRAPLAGVLVGLAIALSGWLCCVLPLWASFYRGKARSRYLTTAAVFGVGGQLARFLLPESLAGTGLISAALGTTTMIVTLVVLGAGSAAAWFWPKDKSETTVVAVSAVLLATLFICTRTGAVAAQTLPWLALVLVGGCASRGRALVTEGVLFPAIRKWRAAAASPDAQS